MLAVVVLCERVELLGVEVADGTEVQRIEDDVRVARVHVLFKVIQVLGGERAVFALVTSGQLLLGCRVRFSLFPVLLFSGFYIFDDRGSVFWTRRLLLL